MITVLTNGKKVANFSSPHDFVFEDGMILPAVSKEEAERLKVDFHEDELNTDGDIELTFSLSLDVIGNMNQWIMLHQFGDVDIVYCPLPMITAIKERYGREWLIKSPFRAIRMVSRTEKRVSIHKQCI